MLAGLEIPVDERLLVGIGGADDAGVYLLDDERALVQTLDFFTPMVDDPRRFGRIAAANAFSDIWAMGGRPLTAMNIVAFPIKSMPHAVLRDILAGALEKIVAAGAVLVGGHSIDDAEIKFGLSVTGIVHPQHVWRNTGGRPGDRLVLTKPIGTGVLATALKAGFCTEDEMVVALDLMEHLNRLPVTGADENEHGADWRAAVHACTDVTGFGLLGHLGEMVADNAVGAVVAADRVPLLPGAEQFCSMGMYPEGGSRNREFFGCRVAREDGVADVRFDLLFDPQTSGGLLFAADPAGAAALMEVLAAAGHGAFDIGRLTADHPGRILVRAADKMNRPC